MRTVDLGLAPPAPGAGAGGQQSQRLLIQLVLALEPTGDRRDPRQVLGGGDLRGLTRRLAWPSESQGALPRLVADPEQDVELREPLGSAALGPGSATLGRFEQPGAPAIRLNVAEGEERAEVHLDPLGLEGAHGRWPSKNAARRARPWGDCRGSAPATT